MTSFFATIILGTLLVSNIMSTTLDERISYYKSKTLVGLQFIIPCWAEDAKILNTDLREDRERYEIVILNMKVLMKHTDFFECDPNILFTGEPLNDGRVASILHRWENQQLIDPPTLYVYSAKEKKLCFSDGRHRTKVAYHLGCLQLPVAINRDQRDIIELIINTQI